MLKAGQFFWTDPLVGPYTGYSGYATRWWMTPIPEGLDTDHRIGRETILQKFSIRFYWRVRYTTGWNARQEYLRTVLVWDEQPSGGFRAADLLDITDMHTEDQYIYAPYRLQYSDRFTVLDDSITYIDTLNGDTMGVVAADKEVNRRIVWHPSWPSTGGYNEAQSGGIWLLVISQNSGGSTEPHPDLYCKLTTSFTFWDS